MGIKGYNSAKKSGSATNEEERSKVLAKLMLDQMAKDDEANSLEAI